MPEKSEDQETGPKEQKEQKPDEQDAPSHGKNFLEWIVFSLSLMLVVSTLGFLAYKATTTEALPPRLEIVLGEPVKAGERVLVPVTIKNLGERTAAGVEVEVERRQSDETAHFSLPYVPREGFRKGWVSFEGPLEKKELKADVVGYEES